MSTTPQPNAVRAAFDSFVSAQENPSSATETPAPVEQAPETQPETPPADPQVDESSEKSAPESPKDIIEFWATDSKGRKKVQVDLSDRKKLEQQLAMAHGARKFQAERDSFKSKYEELEKKHGETASTLSSLEDIYSQHGIEGIVDVLTGEKGGYKKHLMKELEREAIKRTASPEQLKQIELMEELEKERSERRREKQSREAELTRVASDREASQLDKATASLLPVFESVRFAGRLGDTEAENLFDKQIWESTVDAMVNVPAEEWTRERIQMEFKKNSLVYQKFIKQNEKATAKKVVEDKKKDAQVRIAQAVQSSQTASKGRTDITDSIRKGNIADAFLASILGKPGK